MAARVESGAVINHDQLPFGEGLAQDTCQGARYERRLSKGRHHHTYSRGSADPTGQAQSSAGLPRSRAASPGSAGVGQVDG